MQMQEYEELKIEYNTKYLDKILEILFPESNFRKKK